MGKSWVIAGICHELSKLDPDAKIIIFAPSKEILEQNAEKLELYGFDDIKIYSASCGRKEVGQYTMATIGSVKNHPELFKGTKFAIVDELQDVKIDASGMYLKFFEQVGITRYLGLTACVDGETEVLTPDGWVRFDELTGDSGVFAQWEPPKDGEAGEIKFLSASIFRGWADTINSSTWGKEGTTILTTDGHTIPTMRLKCGNKNREKTWKFQVEKSGKIKYNDYVRLFMSGKGAGESDITWEQRIGIMLQADGCCIAQITSGSRAGMYRHSIQVKKPHKKERLIFLLKNSGIDYTINESKEGYTNAYIYLPFNAKTLSNFIDITNLSYNTACEMIDEISHWDGHKYDERIERVEYYSSREDNIDIVQAIAVQAGYMSRKVRRHGAGDRVDSFKLYMSKRFTRTSSALTPEKRIEWNKPVYCLHTQTGYFVARRNGRVFITGNTPFKQRQKYCKQGKFLEYTTSVSLVNRFPPIKGKYNPQFAWGKILYKIEMKDLQDMGYLCPIKYYTEMPQATLRLNSTGGDYAKADIEEFGIQSWNRILTVVTRLVRAKNPKRVLVFAPSVKASQSVSQALIERGISADHVDGKTPKKERDEKIARFRSGETQVMCNCQCLTAGFDLPALDTIVYAMPTLSPSRWIQSIGRCARIDPDNPDKVSEVYDLVGCCLTMGRPETFRIVKEDGFKDMLISERGRIDNVPLATFRIPLQKKEKLDEEYTIWKRD